MTLGRERTRPREKGTRTKASAATPAVSTSRPRSLQYKARVTSETSGKQRLTWALCRRRERSGERRQWAASCELRAWCGQPTWNARPQQESLKDEHDTTRFEMNRHEEEMQNKQETCKAEHNTTQHEVKASVKQESIAGKHDAIGREKAMRDRWENIEGKHDTKRPGRRHHEGEGRNWQESIDDKHNRT